MSISTTMLRNGSWPAGPPTGSVRRPARRATTPLSEPTASRRIAQESPRLEPRPSSARVTQRPRVMRTPEVVEDLRDRRPQLAHGDGDRHDPVVGQHDVGDGLGQALEQDRLEGGDDPLDVGGDGAVVEGVVELVGGAGDREVGDDVEVDLEGLGPLLLLGERAADARSARGRAARCGRSVPSGWSVAAEGQSGGCGSVAATATISRPAGPSWRWVRRSMTVIVRGRCRPGRSRAGSRR